jgi:hypothetical protein
MIPTIEGVIGLVNGDWRIRSYRCTQIQASVEDIDPKQNQFCTFCLHFHRINFKKLYKMALKSERNTTTLRQHYNNLIKESDDIKRKLRNAKQKLDRTTETEVSEWETNEGKMGRCKLYGNLKT